MLTVLRYGDAIGNDVLALDGILDTMGYSAEIHAQHVDGMITLKIADLLKKKKIKTIPPMPDLCSDDVLIYHLSTGTELNGMIRKLSCRKICVYHNITPAEFFTQYDTTSERNCETGIKEVTALKDTFDYCLADSEFNRSDLIKYGFKCPIDVLPILVPFSDYDKKPSRAVMKKYDDDITNIIFVGRVVPNKKQEDVIAAFSAYKKNYNEKSRLFIVGGYGPRVYKQRLGDYVGALELSDDVVFTGPIPFDHVIAYYRLADVFLCMSEHEGFCVPLLEAMHFDVPIIAYDATAVPETLSGSGALINDKDPLLVAGIIDKIVSDKDLRDSIICSQRQRLAYFSYENVGAMFDKYLGDFLK